jgi:hypothetical protein
MPERLLVSRLLAVDVRTAQCAASGHGSEIGRTPAPHQTHSAGRGKRAQHDGVTLVFPHLSPPSIFLHRASLACVDAVSGCDDSVMKSTFLSRHAPATLSTTISELPLLTFAINI